MKRSEFIAKYTVKDGKGEILPELHTKKFDSKSDALNYLMNLLTMRILRLDQDVLDYTIDKAATEKVWRTTTNAYESLTNFIKHKTLDGHLYCLQQIDSNFKYSYSIYRNSQLIDQSNEKFDTQEECYIKMKNISCNYIGYEYYELFEYSPMEIFQNDTTIKTIPDKYMSKIHVNYTPDKITIQFITPDDNGNEEEANCYEIKMTEVRCE